MGNDPRRQSSISATYGIITPDEGGKDVFVRSSGIRGTGQDSLREGQRVEFEITQGEKGLQASNVRLAP